MMTVQWGLQRGTPQTVWEALWNNCDAFPGVQHRRLADGGGDAAHPAPERSRGRAHGPVESGGGRDTRPPPRAWQKPSSVSSRWSTTSPRSSGLRTWRRTRWFTSAPVTNESGAESARRFIASPGPGRQPCTLPIVTRSSGVPKPSRLPAVTMSNTASSGRTERCVGFATAPSRCATSRARSVASPASPRTSPSGNRRGRCSRCRRRSWRTWPRAWW